MKTKYLAFAALATMLASCSNEEEFVPQKDAPITVTVAVNGTNTRAGYETPEGGIAVLPETFYLTITQEEGTSAYNYSNVLMTKGSDNSYTSARELLWKDDASRSPFVSAYTIEGTEVSIAADQSSADKVTANDLLGAYSDYTNADDEADKDITITGDNIAVRFRHLLCKLDVTYTWGTGLIGDATREIAEVVYQGFGTSATLNRETCSITAGSTTGDITGYVNNLLSEAIFAPKVNSDAKLIITVNETTGEGEAAVTTQRVFTLTMPSATFESGKRYTMNVKIGGTAAVVSRVVATPWEEEGNEIDGVTGGEDFAIIDASGMTATALEAKLLTSLNAGETDIAITLAPDAGVEMFSAINTALRASTAEDGSISLTIAGVQTVPNLAFGNGNPENSLNTDPHELGELYFPNAVTLESDAIYAPNLTKLSVPKVTEYKIWAVNRNNLDTLILSAPGTIEANFTDLKTENIDLTLNEDKKSEVTNENEWKEVTWKSISYVK